MQKEVWVDCRAEDLEDLAIEYNATGIRGKSRRGLKILYENSLMEVELRTQDDIEKIREYKDRVSYIVASLPQDWKILPTENLVAALQDSGIKSLIRSNSIEEAKTYAQILESGVDGFIVEDKNKVKDFCSYFSPRPELQLADAEVTGAKRLGLGDRACVDLISSQKQREGMLVGSFANFMFLQDAETEENPYINTRNFRINAGAISLYTLIKPSRTRYLSDLRAGDDALIVDSYGKTREGYVARIKIERRPMILIRATYMNRIGAVVSQYSESVRLVSPDGTIPVTKIKTGDLVRTYVTEPVGMHFGREVREIIIER